MGRCKHPFHSASRTIAEEWKQPKCPAVGERAKRLRSIYSVEYYSAVKKDEILSFVTTWINIEGILVNEIKQTEKSKYHVISLTCGIKKIKPVKKPQRETNT